jgi:hypothetical protein
VSAERKFYGIKGEYAPTTAAVGTEPVLSDGRTEVLGQSFDFLMARAPDPAALAQVEAAFAGSSESDFEDRFRRKGW